MRRSNPCQGCPRALLDRRLPYHVRHGLMLPCRYIHLTQDETRAPLGGSKPIVLSDLCAPEPSSQLRIREGRLQGRDGLAERRAMGEHPEAVPRRVHCRRPTRAGRRLRRGRLWKPLFGVYRSAPSGGPYHLFEEARRREPHRASARMELLQLRVLLLQRLQSLGLDLRARSAVFVPASCSFSTADNLLFHAPCSLYLSVLLQSGL